MMLLVYFGIYLLVLQLQYLPIGSSASNVFNPFQGNRTDEILTKIRNDDFIRPKKTRTFHGQIELETLTSTDGITFIGATAGDQLGYSVCVGGDINGDARADILLGAPGYSSSTGIVYAIYGAASMSNFDMSSFSGGITITGTTGSGLGSKVDIGGDANGDSKAEMLIGAPSLTTNTGAAYIIYGGATLSNVATSSLGTTGIAFTGSGSGDFAGFGLSMNFDNNADGKMDPAMSTYGYSSNTGRTYYTLGAVSMTGSAMSSICKYLNMIRIFRQLLL
jgi:hypothetical protein